ncbi:MAG: cell wall-binding repeat-containing protein [Quadrisphaera sp.]
MKSSRRSGCAAVDLRTVADGPHPPGGRPSARTTTTSARRASRLRRAAALVGTVALALAVVAVAAGGPARAAAPPAGVGAATASWHHDDATPAWLRELGWDRGDRPRAPDRTAAAVALSQDAFPAAGAAPAAVLITAGTHADDLAGAALAARVRGPLLPTPPGRLDGSVVAEVRRAVRTGGTIYVLGGTSAVTDGVEQQLRPGFTVERLAGEDRCGTALAVADRMRALGAKGPTFLLTGTDAPDRPAVAALVARADGVVVLGRGLLMDPDTRQWLLEDDAQGGHTVPVDGENRDDGALRVARALGLVLRGA